MQYALSFYEYYQHFSLIFSSQCARKSYIVQMFLVANVSKLNECPNVHLRVVR